jgi:RHS repeat-associated protein
MITATTGSGTTTYTYDYKNRITNVEVDGTMPATYTYDALGRRIGIDDGGTQTWTVFNGKSADANPYADFTSSGTLKMRYLDGLAVDELLPRTDSSGNTSWYFTDQVGSVIAIASTTAGVQDEITYDPFGNIVTQTDSAEADRFMFAGMEFDSNTGLYYDHARYYDAAIGRFVSQDPKGFAAGDTNLYRYVGNAPTDQTDTSGLEDPNAPQPPEGMPKVPAGQVPQPNPINIGTQPQRSHGYPTRVPYYLKANDPKYVGVPGGGKKGRPPKPEPIDWFPQLRGNRPAPPTVRALPPGGNMKML